MKVVTMCQGGHVRSVALKYLLRYKYGHEVLNCGWEANNKETLKMLFDWAEKIVIMDKNMEKYIPEECKPKLLCYHVGNDVFGNPFHPDLQQICEQLIQKHGLFNK